MKLYNLLFYHEYKLASKNVNFKEFPWLSAAALVTICFGLNTITLIELLLKLLELNTSILSFKYDKYIYSIVFSIIVFGYYMYNSRYKKIYSIYESKEKNSEKKQNSYLVIFAYLFMSIISMVLIVSPILW